MSPAVPRPAGPFVPAGSVRIFDTTLRDGEQAPGAGLTAAEKLEVARQLARLKVDVIEAGLPGGLAGRLRGGPADRPGDARRDRGRGARPLQGRRPAAGHRGDQGRRAAASPRLHRDQRHPPQAQAPDRPRDGARRGGPLGPLRPRAARARRRDRVLRRGRLADRPRLPAQVYEAVVEAGASTVNIPDTVGYAIPSEFGALVEPRRRAGRRRRRRSASTATTTSAWPRPTPWRRSRPAPARSR